jgi:hypothetical protein
MSCFWLGVYRTTNGGIRWRQSGAGLPASTYGRGVWDLQVRSCQDAGGSPCAACRVSALQAVLAF